MAKRLSSLPATWSKHLPLFCRRFYGSEIKGSWAEPPTCIGDKAPKEKPACRPKPTSCLANWCSCGKPNWPKCEDPKLKLLAYLSCCCDDRLSNPPCEPSKTKKPKPKVKVPFQTMWESCGMENKCQVIERLDEVHYMPTDKEKRIYTQTWESCKPVVRKRKVCCMDEMCMVPPLNKRPKDECPQTAKEQDTDKLKVDYDLIRRCLKNVVENPNTKDLNKCHKIRMPCCHNVSNRNFKCRKYAKFANCMKSCCPHPSYSECDHPTIRRKPKGECRCAEFITRCEGNEFRIRKAIYVIPPPLPAWPPKEPKGR